MKTLRPRFLISLMVFGLIASVVCNFVPILTAISLARESVEIDVSYRWGGGHQRLIEEVIQNFNKKNPEINVKGVSAAGRLWEELSAKVIAKLAAGEEPPAVMIPGYYLVEHCVKTFNAARLDEVGGTEATAVFDKFLPAVLTLAQVNGVQYGLPFALSNPVLFYNCDIFEKAGLDPKNPPRTWREVGLMGRIIKDNTKAVPLYINQLDSWYWQALIESNGGNFIKNGRPAFTSAEAIEATEVWVDFYEKKLIPKITRKEAIEAFAAGRMAMNGDSITVFEGFARAVPRLETTQMPTFGSKTKRLPPGGGPLVILARSSERRKAAWELLKYMVSEEAMNIWVQTGYISPLDPAKVKVRRDYRQNPAYEQLQYMVPWVSWPGLHSLEIEKHICDWRDKMLYGEVGVEEGVKKLQKTIEGLLP